MYKNRSQGFTLIELLVVIAIIGILSAVVLASLNTARSKGNDAAVQADLSTIRVQAELYYSDNTNSYGSQTWTNGGTATGAVCTTGMFSNPTITAALIGANAANGTASLGCASAGTSYVVAAVLTSTASASYFCVDSAGVAKIVSATLPASLSACPP